MAGGKMWTPNRLKFNGSLKQDTDGELEPEVGLKIWIAWQQHHPPRLYSYEKWIAQLRKSFLLFWQAHISRIVRKWLTI